MLFAVNRDMYDKLNMKKTILLFAMMFCALLAYSQDVTCDMCPENTATLTVVPTGTAPYTYLWNNAATTASIMVTAAGTYTVDVTDADGCTETYTYQLDLNASPTATVATTDENCGQSDGTATVTPASGLAPYTYLWDDTGASTSAMISGLDAGTYSVTVTDANGCTGTGSGTVSAGSGPSITCVGTDSTCGDETASIDATVVGGVAPITYLWSNAETTEDISGLVSGTYTVTVTDGNGCTDVCSSTVDNGTVLTLTGSCIIN